MGLIRFLSAALPAHARPRTYDMAFTGSVSMFEFKLGFVEGEALEAAGKSNWDAEGFDGSRAPRDHQPNKISIQAGNFANRKDLNFTRLRSSRVKPGTA